MAVAFKKLNSCMCIVTSFCVSVAVSNIGAEWLVGGNVICNVLIACCRCFLCMYQITITLQVRLRVLRLEFQVYVFRFRDLG